MLVLADVAEVVIDRQSALADPGSGLAQTALRGMDPRCLRGEGPGDGVVLADEDTLSVLQQGEGAIGIALSQAELCHGDAPSVRVLGQATEVAKFIAQPKVIGGSIDVVPLQAQLCQPHVHVTRAAQDGCRAVRRHPQALFVAPHRLVQTPLGDTDLRQWSVATDRIDRVARALQARHRLGPEAMGGLEIATSPVRQGKEPRRRTAPEWVVFAGEVERPTAKASVRSRSPFICAWAARYRATALGNRRNSASSTTTIDRGRGLLSLPIVGRWFQPSLRPTQQHLDIRRLAGGHERSDIPDAQDRPNLKHLIGKLLEPTPHRGFLARLSEARDRRLDHVGGPLVVFPVECVANGLKPLPALLVPDTRAPMEVRDAVRLLAQQARPEDIREQVVVSVPLAARVERDHEEVPAIEILEGRFDRHPLP